MSSSASQRVLSSPPTDAISGLTYSPSSPSRLLVSSWDKYVRVYDTQSGDQGEGQELTRIAHAAPVLDCCYGEQDGDMYSAGLDWTVNKLDAETGSVETIGKHASAVKSICYSTEHHSLISGSWDCNANLWDPRSPGEPTSSLEQPQKIYSISTSHNYLVLAMATRLVHIYDLRSLSAPLQRRESSLKFMTRTVACMPNGTGYATSSIEGRIAVEFFDPSEESQKRKYAFKCHRQVVNSVDTVYPVNCLAFHPKYGTFASGGGDGVVSLWDGMAKRRLKQYSGYGSSVAGLGFNCDGRQMAVGVSSGFEDGHGGGESEQVKVYVRELAEGEGKGKGQ